MGVVGGRYRLIDLIGMGGMAAVWRAHDEVLDRFVAVKLLTGDQCADPGEFERARREARFGARLAHPNVAAVYDFGTSRRGGRGMAFVVMELVDGMRLSDSIDRGPLNWRFAVRICAELSAGLAAAHDQGIVHRDIKPDNVVLTESGAKLLDFGIAARVGEPTGSPTAQSWALRATWHRSGSGRTQWGLGWTCTAWEYCSTAL
jgi:serine/threonine protein kinase, bacterial